MDWVDIAHREGELSVAEPQQAGARSVSVQEETALPVKSLRVAMVASYHPWDEPRRVFIHLTGNRKLRHAIGYRIPFDPGKIGLFHGDKLPDEALRFRLDPVGDVELLHHPQKEWVQRWRVTFAAFDAVIVPDFS